MRLLFDHGTLVLVDAPDERRSVAPSLLWDARVGLFRAPAFRYGEVVEFVEEHGLELTDEVRECSMRPTGHWQAVELRPYQEAALLSWQVTGGRGVVVLPTGSGKTRVAVGAIASKRVSTLCLVPTRALLEQWQGELQALGAGPIGCLGDGRHTIEPITVSTFESAYRYMPRLGARFELLVVDEVHHFGVGARDEALEMSVARFRLGLTATPPADPALSRLADLVGPVVYRLGVLDLSGSFLAEFDLVTVHLGLEPGEHARYTADRRVFSEVHRRFRRLHPFGTWPEFVSLARQSREGLEALEAWRRSRRVLGLTRAKARAVRLLLARHRGSRVLIFTADNEAAYAIARQELVMPITCDISRAERQRALAAFQSGELRVLVSARVLNEGIDVPDADVAIVVGATQGEREHVQRVGRLLRPVPGKRALVYELVTDHTYEPRRAAERRRALASASPYPP